MSTLKGQGQWAVEDKNINNNYYLFIYLFISGSLNNLKPEKKYGLWAKFNRRIYVLVIP